MTPVLQVPELTRFGRFGNWLGFYAIAHYYADLCGAELQTCPWVGDKVFKLDSKPISGRPIQQIGYPFPDRFYGIAELYFSQNVSYSVNYSQADFRRYFPLPDMASGFTTELVVHHRKGDFLHSNQWPHVSEETLRKGVEAHGFKFEDAVVVTEENPHWIDGTPSGEPFVTDFLLMCFARNLWVYPNSSFSGHAAALNRANVYLPEGFSNGPTECVWRKRVE